MDSLLKKLLDPQVFSAFVSENMKTSTYKANWKGEMDVEYEPSKAYKAIIAEYAAAVAGSIIDKNAEKPTHSLPTAAELTGSIARMADEWQMDNDKLDQFLYLENRYRSKFGTNGLIQGNVQSVEQYRKLVKFLFGAFESAVIAPHKRIDLLYYEGLFKGSMTLSATNNSKSGLTFSLSTGATQYKCLSTGAVWGATGATPLADLQACISSAESNGKAVQKIRMSRNTYANMCKVGEFTSVFKLNLGLGKVSPSGVIPVEIVNQYLESISLPMIVIESPKLVLLPSGSSTNAIPDNRVVLQCADKVAVLKVADSTEMADPLPNKTYATYDDNLVGQWRDSKGRFVDYEMWAMPVFTGRNDYFILKTDEVNS